jgi:Uncharacterized conserved protein (some members contain a von Willebrand factor type A (vWA) domain)
MWLNRFVWFLWLIGVALLHLFGNNLGTRIILISSVIIPITGIIITLAIKKKNIKAELSIKNECKKHEDIAATIKISNHGHSVVCDITCVNLLTNEKTIIDFSNYTIDYPINSNYCGKLRIIVDNFILYDPFKLLKRKLNLSEEVEITVIPDTFNTQIELIDDIANVIDNDIYSTAKAGNDMSETFAVREYIPGDSIKSIHWKLSQKSDKLMVREFGLPIVNQILILLETAILNEVTPEQIDAMAEVFISVSLKLAEQDIPHTAGWKQDEIEINSKEDVSVLIDKILSNTVTLSDTTTITSYRDNLESYSHIVVISSYIEPDIDSLYNGNRVTLLHCGDEHNSLNNIHIIPFSVDNYQTDLSVLEI